MGTVASAVDETVLDRLRLFRGADPRLIGAHLDACPTRTVARGERLLAKGQSNRDTYLVLAGRLGVYLDSGDPPLVTLGPGECVGEMSVITNMAASADVSAETDCRLLVVPHDTLWALVDASHEVARNLLHVLADRVRHDDEVMRAHQRARRALERDASIDPLTGLHNRRWMDEMYDRELARCRRAGKPLSLLLIDADRFKAFNDQHGHLAGDMLLRVLARVIRDTIRPTDLAARYGGEEFTVLLADAGRPEAMAAAERLRSAVERAEVSGGGGRKVPMVTVSIGVAALDGHESVDSLVGAADAALYRAKDQGRNRVSD